MKLFAHAIGLSLLVILWGWFVGGESKPLDRIPLPRKSCVWKRIWTGTGKRKPLACSLKMIFLWRWKTVGLESLGAVE